MPEIARHITLTAGCFAFLGAGTAHADAYRLPYHSASASGQGQAFSAQADDASALFYNPAGLARLGGVQVNAGFSLVGDHTRFTSPTGVGANGDFGEDFAFPPPAGTYLAANLQDVGVEALGPLTIGLGLDSPYGLAMRYPDPAPFEATLTRAKLPLLAIKPTLAYRVNDRLSIGLGADIYTFAGFIGAGGYETQAKLPDGNRTELNMDGTAAGFNASLLFTPWRTDDGRPRLNLGFVYRSGARLPLHGHYTVNSARVATVNSALELPEVITAAIAYWPIRNASHEWKLEYDMDFVGWDSFRTLDLKFSDGSMIRTPENWRATYTASAGTEFRWLKPEALPDWEVALRAGYQHSANAIPSYTLSPAVVDNDWNLFSLGLGLTCKGQGRWMSLIRCAGEGSLAPKAIGMDLAFQTIFFEPRRIVGNLNPAVDGTYETIIYVGSVNFRLSY